MTGNFSSVRPLLFFAEMGTGTQDFSRFGWKNSAWLLTPEMVSDWGHHAIHELLSPGLHFVRIRGSRAGP